ncbi:sugar/nucleoside kinase (ribokinase family) [Streptomyces canus]|nr:sugar/nucleoside kinase (ribokinase family) [Streptomyces canus]
MTHIAVLGSTDMDLVTYVEKAPQRGETVTGRDTLTGRSDPFAAGAALLDRIPGVVITLGAAGSVYLTRDAEPLAAPAPQVTAVDSTGAGDTYVGAVALGEERPIRESMAWAAALCVQREGASASMPCRSEIEARYTS